MAEALELAARGLGRVSPNPMVGAVLVKAGKVVSRGWHRQFGGAHAEVEAIRNAGGNARGSTLYVTMEPCCFHGKTPACTGAVHLAEIREVVAATLDPNPKVNGKGMRQLRGCGMKTSVGLLGAEARELNEAYFTHMRKQRPFVVLKVAVTLDGMMADSAGESKWITGPEARARGHKLREAADAIVVGIDTVLHDDPLLTCRTMKDKRLVRVVLDPDLELELASRLLEVGGPALILTTNADSTRAQRLRKAGAEVVSVKQNLKGLLEWSAILAELHRRELMTVLIEGGATVAGTALDAGIVDKVYAFQSAMVMGAGRSFSGAMRPRRLKDALRLERVDHECLGDDFLTTGYVHRTD